MPYGKFKVGEEYCVYQKDDNGNKVGESLGCHSSESDADDQVAALYANEDKARDKRYNVSRTDERAEKIRDEKKDLDVWYVPWGVTTFADLDVAHASIKATRNLDTLTWQFHDLVDNILFSDLVSNKVQAIQGLTSEFATRVASVLGEATEPDEDANAPEPAMDDDMISMEKKPGWIDKVVAIVKAAMSPPPSEPTTGGLMVWKDAETGCYKWVSSHTNSFRDDDNPPELLKSDAHKDFVARVKAGETPMPQVWINHNGAFKWGEATYVTYDEVKPGVVFTIAGGEADKDKEYVAEALAALPQPIPVSHGMPKKSIQRDPMDPTIITRYDTIEISPLVGKTPANKLATFMVLTKEVNAMFNDEEKQQLANALFDGDMSRVELLQQANASTAGKAQAEGIQAKAQKEGETEAEPEAEATPEAPVTLEEVAKDLKEVAAAVTLAITKFGERMAEQDARLKAVVEHVAQDEKAMSPAASIYAAINSAVGDPSAQVKSGDPVRDKAPVETQSTAKAQAPSPWLQTILDANANADAPTGVTLSSDQLQGIFSNLNGGQQ